MLKNIKKNKTYIIAFVLLTVVVLLFVVNWQQNYNFALKSQPSTSAEIANSSYQINVYYFPSRKRAATALTYYFSQQGFPINMQPAESLDGLDAFRHSTNRIFFNHDQFATAMEIKDKTQRILGYPLNAYRYKVTQNSHSMMIVFTEGAL